MSLEVSEKYRQKYIQTANYKQWIKIYNKKWYSENKERKLKQSRESRAKMSLFINEQKTLSGCSRCGFNEHPCALEYHHLDGSEKILSVGSMRLAYSKESIIAEMKKCIVLCSNCHRIIHQEERDNII